MLFPYAKNILLILSNIVSFQFVLAAQHICQKLRNAGCWADFVNPFSGAPAVGAYARKQNTMEANECTHSLEFSITERHHCRVIEDKKARSFVGEYFKLFISRGILSLFVSYSHAVFLYWNFLRKMSTNLNYELSD